MKAFTFNPASIPEGQPYLANNRYGKSLVRLVKVTRNGAWHEMKELTVQVLLSGQGLDLSYYTGDNSSVVPTDTIKNVVHVLAKQHPIRDPESFGVFVAAHFLKEYSHITKVRVDIVDHPWVRMEINGKPHPHSFSATSPELRTASIKQVKGKEPKIISGMKEVLILKTTGSGFEGFPRCKHTTLPETKDRLFKTKVTATWNYGSRDVDYNAVYNGVKESIFKVFAENYSHAVQETIFQMGEAVLKRFPEVKKIHFSLPNQHNWTINLSPFGLENNGEVLMPTADPQGLIEGTIARKKKAKL
jgi:urate oxidase